MIYKIASVIVVISVLFEVVERVFPINKMNETVRSFSKIFILYLLCKVVSQYF